MSYLPTTIEPKWQQYWLQQKTYNTQQDSSRPKFYVLDMFPYPSGAGLHLGHPVGYTATDIISRYKRMKGYNVLHPMGFDAFGLPTERYSMKTGIHPRIATEANIENFTRQLQSLGFDYDWDRVINTTEPSYYRWTQWIFLLIYNSWYDTTIQKARPIEELPIPESITDTIEIERYKDQHRLAYIAHIPVNWCEELGTVLANEEVDEWVGKGYTVERKPMRQWMLRITAYGERLLNDLELVNWPPSTKDMQKNWIGKSIGAEIHFTAETGDIITVFTTRPDTVFGATYLVLAPEHPLVTKLTEPSQRTAVEAYIAQSALKSDMERTELAKEKTGTFTGAYAINPASGERIPIWIADYVLAHYGTGAIMAVPGHDTRDHEFAKAFSMSIKQVVIPTDGTPSNITEEAFIESGKNVNSSNNEVTLDGLTTPEAKKAIIAWLESKGLGIGKTQYKLRDWLFSRQRYWGEPVPIIFFPDGTKRALTAEELPLILPEVEHFKPAGTGESPLATVESWVNYHDPVTGKTGSLETNTMPQWAGSCWYYLRYISPQNNLRFTDAEDEQYWMANGGVDLYVGGTEHAVLHLLYARFWHKVLFDYGYVSTPEPFQRLFHQGLLLGEDSRKMSKSLGNVVNPDEIISKQGADTLRMYEMFMGPLEQSKPWSSKGVEGIFRFLNRVWRLIADENGQLLPSVQEDVPLSDEEKYQLHYTIKKVSEDIESLSYNTAIAQMMIFLNTFSKAEIRNKAAMEAFVQCLAPFAPHITEELWHILGHKTSVHTSKFPDYSPEALVQDSVEVLIQINSKIKAKLVVPSDTSEEELAVLALADERISSQLQDKSIKKRIFVINKLINFIIA